MCLKRVRQGLVLIILSFTFIMLAAPFYLTYTDAPHKVDAVVVLVGPGYDARLKEARKLINEGYGNYLMIPAHSEIAGPFYGAVSFNPERLLSPCQWFDWRKKRK